MMIDVGLAVVPGVTVSCTVKLVGLVTVTFDAVIPGAAVTCVKPCAKCVFTPVSVTMMLWPALADFGAALARYGVPAARS